VPSAVLAKAAHVPNMFLAVQLAAHQHAPKEG
jgi:hypothetical protein